MLYRHHSSTLTRLCFDEVVESSALGHFVYTFQFVSVSSYTPYSRGILILYCHGTIQLTFTRLILTGRSYEALQGQSRIFQFEFAIFFEPVVNDVCWSCTIIRVLASYRPTRQLSHKNLSHNTG